jgi:hypothetical protein
MYEQDKAWREADNKKEVIEIIDELLEITDNGGHVTMPYLWNKLEKMKALLEG